MEHAFRISPPPAALRFLQVAARPFRAFALWLVRVGECSPMMLALDRLSNTSDDSLAARGLTRLDEVRRILGPRAAL